MSPSIKLIIFDLDGTLVDAYRAVYASLNYALEKLGYKRVDHDTVRKSVGWGDKNLLRRFVNERDVEKVLAIYRRHHQEALKRGTKFLPYAKRLLNDLSRQKYRLAIASNRPTRFTRIILKHLKAIHYFDCILCADKVEHPKPKPDILKAIIKRVGVRKEQALYVGDMTIDIETGKSAGVKTVAVTTGSSSERELLALRPYKIIGHVGKLGRVLKNFH